MLKTKQQQKNTNHANKKTHQTDNNTNVLNLQKLVAGFHSNGLLAFPA